MWHSTRNRALRRGDLEHRVLPQRRPQRAAHAHEGDALDVPYWFSHSGRVRRRSARLTPRHTHRIRGRDGGR